MKAEELLDYFAETLAARLAEKLRADLPVGQGRRQRLLSVDEAAIYLGRSAHSVRHLIAGGKLRVVKIDGRLFLDVRDLDELIDASK